MSKDFDKDGDIKISSDYDVEKIIAEVNKTAVQEKEAFTKTFRAENTPQNTNQINQSLESGGIRNKILNDDAAGLQKEIERDGRYNELRSIKVNSHKGRNAVLFVLGLVVILLIGAYIVGFMMTKDSFLPNTFVNGISIGGMNVNEAAEAVHSGTAADKLVLKKLNGETVTIDYSKIDYTYSTADELNKIMNQESKALWFVNLINKSSYTISTDRTYSEDKLKEIIENASFGVTPSKNAKIVMQDDGFVIEPEVQGDIADTEKPQRKP